MPLFNHNINNLSGGVSQQVDESRHSNQVDSMNNFIPTVAQGLRRRNPVSSSITLNADISINTAIHSYSRGDGIEKYGMIMNNGGLKVFDTLGIEKTVIDIGVAGEEVLTQWLWKDLVYSIRTPFSSLIATVTVVSADELTTSYLIMPSAYDQLVINLNAGWKILTSAGYKTREELTASNTWSIRYHYYSDSNSATYADRDMNIPDWNNSIKFLTVGDTTWILNKSITSTLMSDITPYDTHTRSVFYWINKSFNDGTTGLNHGYTYKLILTDYGLTPAVVTASYNHTDSIVVATNIASQINGVNGYVARSEGSLVYVYRDQNIISNMDTPADATYKWLALWETLTGIITFYDVTSPTQYASFISNLSTRNYYLKVSAFILSLDELLRVGSFSVGYYPSASTSDTSSYVTRTIENDADYTMSYGDSWGNQASIAWGDGVAKISDLPASMSGFTNEEVGTIAITGTDKDTFTNYYLAWEDDHWKETVKEGIQYKIDYKTMPAKLVRQTNGTFALGWNTENAGYDGFDEAWGERDKGDDDSNPIPSFIGSQISNMFFFKNRLGFTSGENVILSMTANYYDFFATTVIEILDTDPIDAAADSNNISIIRAVNVTAGAVTLWTDTAQFILSGGEILSPTTTRISQTSSYVADTTLNPVSVDNEIMFFSKSGNWLEASSYAPATLTNDKSTAMSLSSHVPEYLPSTIEQIEVSQGENMVFFFSPAEPTKLYVYKYHIKDNQRIMSSWFAWTFPLTIRKIHTLESTLFILAGTSDMYSMDLSLSEITDSFLDFGTTSYTSDILMSRFHIQTEQNSQFIREKMYVKTVVSVVEGEVDLYIKNEDRGTENTTLSANVKAGRKILVGSDSDRVKIGFRTNYSTGCAINILNIEGRSIIKSINKD